MPPMILKEYEEILNKYEETLEKLKWMEVGLEQLVKRYPNDMELGSRIREFVQPILDGEPTTADEFNEEDD